MSNKILEKILNYSSIEDLLSSQDNFISSSSLIDILNFVLIQKVEHRDTKCYLDKRYAFLIPLEWRNSFIFYSRFVDISRTYESNTLILFNSALGSSHFKNFNIPASIKDVKLVFKKESDVTNLVSGDYSTWAHRNNRLRIKFITESHFFNKVELGSCSFLNLDRVGLLSGATEIESWGLANGALPLERMGFKESNLEEKVYLSLSHGLIPLSKEELPDFNQAVFSIIQKVFSNNLINKEDKGAVEFLVQLLNPLISNAEWMADSLIPVK